MDNLPEEYLNILSSFEAGEHVMRHQTIEWTVE